MYNFNNPCQDIFNNEYMNIYQYSDNLFNFNNNCDDSVGNIYDIIIDNKDLNLI